MPERFQRAMQASGETVAIWAVILASVFVRALVDEWRGWRALAGATTSGILAAIIFGPTVTAYFDPGLPRFDYFVAGGLALMGYGMLKFALSFNKQDILDLLKAWRGK